MIQGLQRDVKYHEEKVREYDKKIRQLEHNISEEIQLKERARLNLQVLYVSTWPRSRSLDMPSTPPFISSRGKIVSISPFSLYSNRFFDISYPVLIGFRAKVGTCIERRVLRHGASQSGDGDSQGRGTRARGESFADEEHKCRDAIDGRRGGFQDLQGRS